MSASAEVRADTAFPHIQSGFSFENTRRNAFLKKMGGQTGGAKHHLPEATKTGTTIVGVCFDGGVVLGADTRATGSLVVDKNCDKIHYIADNIFCCGAGTAADTEMTTAQVSSQLELLRLNSGLDSRVTTAVTMLKRHLYGYQGQVSAACVLGGVDITGPHLYTVYPHGSTDKLPFATMGSGSLAAMSVFESEYKDDLTKEQAMEMVCNAIEAGIFNDLGSGSNVDLLVIEKTGASHHRSYRRPNDQAQLRARLNVPSTAFSFPVGTTPVESEEVFELGAKPTAAAASAAAPMDTA